MERFDVVFFVRFVAVEECFEILDGLAECLAIPFTIVVIVFDRLVKVDII